jgi:hypothetical protein
VDRDDVDAFFAARAKSLDAVPDWRTGNRAGEQRSSIPVAVGGAQSPVSLEMTVRLSDPEYLMALLLVSKKVICRLCTATGHFDRVLGEVIDSSHFHAWSDNRPTGPNLPKHLRNCVTLPSEIVGRAGAFAWFLNETGIASPPWVANGWPRVEAFL